MPDWIRNWLDTCIAPVVRPSVGGRYHCCYDSGLGHLSQLGTRLQAIRLCFPLSPDYPESAYQKLTLSALPSRSSISSMTRTTHMKSLYEKRSRFHWRRGRVHSAANDVVGRPFSCSSLIGLSPLRTAGQRNRSTVSQTVRCSRAHVGIVHNV